MIKKVINKLSSTLLNTYQELFHSTSDYQKFVVLARSRTGSNLLISLLNTNPKIKAFGEQFNFLGEKTTQELYKEVFPKQSGTVRGFKLFYYHPIDSDDKSIWDILKNDKNIKIIHLQRKNLLRVHISRLIAEKTKSWNGNPNNKIELKEKKVKIDYQTLIDDFEKTNKYITNSNSLFKNHEVIEVYYEELVNNRDDVMQRVFNFLNVPNKLKNSRLRKQNPEQLDDLVINFSEIKNQLTGTEYEFMLYDHE